MAIPEGSRPLQPRFLFTFTRKLAIISDASLTSPWLGCPSEFWILVWKILCWTQERQPNWFRKTSHPEKVVCVHKLWRHQTRGEVDTHNCDSILLPIKKSLSHPLANDTSWMWHQKLLQIFWNKGKYSQGTSPIKFFFPCDLCMYLLRGRGQHVCTFLSSGLIQCHHGHGQVKHK